MHPRSGAASRSRSAFTATDSFFGTPGSYRRTGHLPGSSANTPPPLTIRSWPTPFFLSGYIESWGRGIEKIAQECEAHGIESPDYDSGMSGLMLTFHASVAYLALINPKPAEPGLEGTAEKGVGKMSGKIVSLLESEPGITIPELALRLKRTARTVERLIRHLKSEKVIARVGPAKGGHWEVLL